MDRLRGFRTLVIQDGSVSLGGKEAEQLAFVDGRLEEEVEPVEGLDTEALKQIITLCEDGSIAYQVMGFTLYCEPSQQ